MDGKEGVPPGSGAGPSVEAVGFGAGAVKKADVGCRSRTRNDYELPLRPREIGAVFPRLRAEIILDPTHSHLP